MTEQLSQLLRPDGAPRIPELQIRMRCDGAPSVGVGACKGLVEFAARIWVPSATPREPDHEFLRMMTSLHCCAEHRGFIDRESFMTGTMKALFEDAGRKMRPLDFRCEFDNAFIEYVDVRSDEYRAFLASPRGRAVLVTALQQRRGSLIHAG